MTVVGAPSATRARLERIETIRLESQPNILWVEVTDENGVTGLGETYYVPGAVEAVLHELIGPLVLGTDAQLAEVRKRPLADALRVLRGESPKDAVP